MSVAIIKAFSEKAKSDADLKEKLKAAKKSRNCVHSPRKTASKSSKTHSTRLTNHNSPPTNCRSVWSRRYYAPELGTKKHGSFGSHFSLPNVAVQVIT